MPLVRPGTRHDPYGMNLSGIRKLPPIAALAACVTLAVACSGGSAPSVPGTTGPTMASSQSTVATTSPSPVPKLSIAQLKQRAAADSASMLAQFAPPPGAKKLTKAPAAAAKLLAHPTFTTGSFDSEHAVAWWQAPGVPVLLLAWEEGNIPSKFQIYPVAQPPIDPVPTDTYFLPPVTGVLSTRALVVSMASAGHGQVAIRVDAEADWQPPRPAAEVAPASAKSVTIAETCQPHAKCIQPKKTITITSAALVDHIAGVLNELAVFPPGIFLKCPPPTGLALTVTFRKAGGGTPLFVAVNTGPCGSVLVTMNGKPTLPLADPGPFTAAGNYATQMINAALLNWKL
jgi:hypothetical protein